MALGIYSGKDAFIDGVSCTTSWQATQGVAAQRYTASCTPGGSNVSPGIQNWAGQAAGIGFLPPLMPGTGDFAFLGVINNDAGQGDLLSLDGDVLVEQCTIDINKESAAVISWQSSFGFQGTPTTSATGADDATVADPYYGDALDIRIGASPATIASASVCIRTAQIVFRRQVTTYVKDGTTFRRAGHLEVDVSFSVYSPNLFVTAYAPNTLAKTRIYTSADSYWEFGKLRFLGKSNLQVDRQSNNILGYTVNAQWNAADAGVLGYIGYFDVGDDVWTMTYGAEPV